MRYLSSHILRDLDRKIPKMVFLGGPRQSGKTFLAKHLLESTTGRYFNWDSDEDRAALLKREWGAKERLVVLDELHKYSRWKNWIKGIFDTDNGVHRFLVTGSARLDVYRRGGDSLMGRYHYWRLHPFTLCERPNEIDLETAFSRLMTLGGFPEPFLSGDELDARRWRRERFDKIVRDDLRDLENIRDISRLTLLVDALRERVGSTIAPSNLANDLQVAPKTVVRWIELLEKMYLIFSVPAYSGKLTRTLSKPLKIYFFDNADVQGDNGARFENLVATHLLKQCHFLEDATGYRFQLCYVRDREGHEVDFAILKERQLEALIEAKYSDRNLSDGLRYFSARMKAKRNVQIVADFKPSRRIGEFEIVPVSALSEFRYTRDATAALWLNKPTAMPPSDS